MDATPKLAETEAPVVAGEPVAAAPVRAGSSSSSSDEEKAAKKAKNKSRSASRKRASIFGGLLGKKDKEGEAVKAEPEIKKEEPTAVPHLDESMFHCSSS
jgi:mevalonate pyrophosphate decarboxylase